MDIRDAIDLVVMGDDLSIDAAASVMCQIMSGEATPAQLGSLLTGLRLKGETTEEVWFYEHPYPPGAKSYNKTKPIRIEESVAQQSKIRLLRS